MAKMLNPITYTENVVEDFLRYQLTTYSFADPSLHRQMRQLLNLDQTRRTPLLAGPFVSLSRSFRRARAPARRNASSIRLSARRWNSGTPERPRALTPSSSTQ